MLFIFQCSEWTSLPVLLASEMRWFTLNREHCLHRGRKSRSKHKQPRIMQRAGLTDDQLKGELASCVEGRERLLRKLREQRNARNQRKRLAAAQTVEAAAEEASNALVMLRDDPQPPALHPSVLASQRRRQMINHLLEAQERGEKVIVLRNAVELPPGFDAGLDELVGGVGPAERQSIQPDRTRHQVALPIDRRMPKPVMQAMTEIDAIVRFGFFGRTPSAYMALWSNEGCLLQHPHSDFKFTGPPPPLPDDINERAFSMLFCTNDGGILPIWDDDDDLEQFELVQLNRGDLCFFRYDVTHAGAPYPAGHKYRIHTHLDSASIVHQLGYIHKVRLHRGETIKKFNKLVTDAVVQLEL